MVTERRSRLARSVGDAMRETRPHKVGVRHRRRVRAFAIEHHHLTEIHEDLEGSPQPQRAAFLGRLLHSFVTPTDQD